MFISTHIKMSDAKEIEKTKRNIESRNNNRKT